MATYYYSSLFKKSDVRITTGFSSSHMALDLSRGVVNSPIYSPNKLGAGTVSSVYTSYTRAGKVYPNSLVVWIKYDIGISMAMYHGEVRHQKVKVGDRIQVGQQIYVTGNTGYSFGDHLHIELWQGGVKINPSTWVLNDNVPVASFKVGDKVEFTGIQYIRSGAGDKFDISRSTIVGEIATIKDGPRTSQNELFKKGSNDSYTWWDMKFENGGTGWVADVGKFKIHTTPQAVIPSPEDSTQPTELEKCQEILDTLQTEIRGLKEALRLSEERVGFLESIMAVREKEYSDLESDYQRILKERNTFEKEKLDLQEKLDRLTQENSHWLEKFRDDIFEIVSKYRERLIEFLRGRRLG